MNHLEIKKMLIDLTIEPYIYCELTHTLSTNKQQMVSISFEKKSKTYKIINIQQGTTAFYEDVDAATVNILELLNNR